MTVPPAPRGVPPMQCGNATRRLAPVQMPGGFNRRLVTSDGYPTTFAPRRPARQTPATGLAPHGRGVKEAPAGVLRWVAALAGRPARFALTGGLAAMCQLTLLFLLTSHGWDDELANVLAFILATQTNFALSSLITWRDRLPAQGQTPLLWRRWLTYQASTAAMAVVNLLVYSVARHVLPVLVASGLGIAAGALGNYLLGDRLVFRPSRDTIPFPRYGERSTSKLTA